ncbi:MAG: hypothetical protein ACQEXX_19940 [Bacillota bacterium]
MSITTHCNAGCNQAFTFDDFTFEQLHDGVVKTYFTCPHCGHEYTASYIDEETRNLQEKIRKVQRRFANPNYNHAVVAKQEAKIKKQIEAKMDALRERM